MHEPQVIRSHGALIKRVKKAYPDHPVKLKLIKKCLRESNYGAIAELLSFSHTSSERKYTAGEIVGMVDANGVIPPAKLAELTEQARRESDYARRLVPLRAQLCADFRHTYLRR